MRNVVAAALSAASIALSAEAHACVGIDFGRMTEPNGAATEQIVARAASIEIMRVERREFVADTQVPQWGPIYRYTLRSVETLAGRSRGQLNVLALDGGARVSQWRREGERWWEPPFEGVPRLRFPDLSDGLDFGFNQCDGRADFALGGTYLVFRNRAGEILQPTHLLHSSTRGEIWVYGPAFEPIPKSNTPWLLEVRSEIAAQGPRQPVLLDWMFDAVFGAPRT